MKSKPQNRLLSRQKAAMHTCGLAAAPTRGVAANAVNTPVSALVLGRLDGMSCCYAIGRNRLNAVNTGRPFVVVLHALSVTPMTDSTLHADKWARAPEA